MVILCKGHSNKAATGSTLRQRQKIVVVCAVCIGAQMGPFIWYSHHPDIGLFARSMIQGEEPLLASFYSLNRVFTSNAPTALRVANVRDVLMVTISLRLIDAGNLELLH